MPPHDDIQHLIAIHNKRLQKLKEQQALKGAYADPAISIEIEDLETKIAQLQADLAALKNVEEDPEPDPKTPWQSKSIQVGEVTLLGCAVRNLSITLGLFIFAGALVAVFNPNWLQDTVSQFQVPATLTPTNTPTPTSTPRPTHTPTPTFTPVTPTVTRVSTPPVPPLPALPQASYRLTANKSVINEGESVELRWETQGIKAALLNGGNFNNEPIAGDRGSMSDRPITDTTYILNVILPDGSFARSNSVSVQVIPAVFPLPIPQPPTNVRVVRNGEELTITWSTSAGSTYDKITTNVCEACNTEFCTPTWSEKPQEFDQITGTSFTFTDAPGCIGPRETGQIQACNRSGCSASVPWAEPTPIPTATP